MDPGADQRKSPGADSFGRSILHAAVECDRVERRLRVRIFRRIEIVGAAREIALRSGCGSTQESGCGFLWPFGSPRFERLRLSRKEDPGAGPRVPFGAMTHLVSVSVSKSLAVRKMEHPGPREYPGADLFGPVGFSSFLFFGLCVLTCTSGVHVARKAVLKKKK